jgi:hypothetical protein
MRPPMQTARLAELYDHWDALRQGREMPSRGDVDVFGLKPWLGNLSLMSVIDGGADFFFRVHGSNLRELVDIDLTGRSLRALPYDWVTAWQAEYLEVVRTRAPVFRSRRPSVRKNFIAVEKLMLPLSVNGADVGHILYAVYPIRSEAADLHTAPAAAVGLR